MGVNGRYIYGCYLTGYPYLLHLEDFEAWYDRELVAGMTFCIENYIGEHSDADTDNGSERII